MVLPDGVYNIKTANNTTLPVYCAFDYTHNYSWTLIQTTTLSNGNNVFHAFVVNITDYQSNINEIESNKTTSYRLSKQNQLFSKSNLQFMMATCNFKIDQSIDYWILKLDDLSLDPFSQLGKHNV